MTKIAGSESGSISQRHGSADPDPPLNVMDPQHCSYLLGFTCGLTSGGPGRASEEVSGSGCGCRLWLDPGSGSF